jgi:hypothetical protein
MIALPTVRIISQHRQSDFRWIACPGFTAIDLNDFRGTHTVQGAAREPLRLALLGADATTGTFSTKTARSRGDSASLLQLLDQWEFNHVTVTLGTSAFRYVGLHGNRRRRLRV